MNDPRTGPLPRREADRRTRRDVMRTLAAPVVGAMAPELGRPAAARQQPADPPDAIVADGLVGNGVTDDTAALQWAIDMAADSGRPLTIPPGFYAVYHPLFVRTGMRIYAYDATLVTHIPSLGEEETAPTVRIHDVTDVEIHGLSVDGRKDHFEHTQWKHGFSLHNTRGILLQDCAAFDCKGDGIILDDFVRDTVNADILVVSSLFQGNYRNGGSAQAAHNVEFRDCVFSDTHGTKPMAGFDVEPDVGEVMCADVRFVRCHFIDNGDLATDSGSGFNVSFTEDAVAVQENVVLVDCLMSGNVRGGVDLYRAPRAIRLENCDITGNHNWGIRIFDDGWEITLVACRVHENRGHGVLVELEDDEIVDDIALRQTSIMHSEGDGVHLAGNVTDVLISECTIAGSMRFGMFAEESVVGVRVENSEFFDNGWADIPPETLDRIEQDDE